VFVFVTSRRWRNKTDWEESKRNENRWRDVRAFDVDDLEQAVQTAPAVHVWLSELLAKPVRGSQSIENWWQNFSARTNPALTYRHALSGRDDAAAELLSLLGQDRTSTVVGAVSTNDALAFVASVMLSSADDTSLGYISRTLVVNDVQYVRLLDGQSDLILLMPDQSEFRQAIESIRGPHGIYLNTGEAQPDLVVPPIDQPQFKQLLVDDGVAVENAERLASAASQSLRKFQRLATKDGPTYAQEWAGQLRQRTVRLAWLAGGWNAAKSGDVEVLGELLGCEYREAVDALTATGRGPDPLFLHEGDVWAVASPEDSWDICVRQVTSSDIERVELAIQTVLGAIDPALELPLEDRWLAEIYGKARIHSPTLRRGLATTLALCGAKGAATPLGTGRGRTLGSWAEDIIFTLLDRANSDQTGQLWSSLSDVLPLLAEAAPDVFVRAVSTGLIGSAPVLKLLFTDEAASFTASSPHTGLLWALEGLAWSSDHFSLTVTVLARLTEVDPGGRLSNRPLGCLTAIFRPWLPQTSASATRRKDVMSDLCDRYPEVAWRLLKTLLPERHAIGMATHSPAYRDWKPSGEGVTYQEFGDTSSFVISKVLEFAVKDPEKWIEIASYLPDFPLASREQAYTQLKQMADLPLTEEMRLNVWQALNEVLRRHRAYAETDWTLSAEELHQFEQAIAGLVPERPTQRHKWLFDEQMPDIQAQRAGDLDVYSKELSALRTKAVDEILDDVGLTGVFELSTEASFPWGLGIALAESSQPFDAFDVLDKLDAADPHQVDLALAFVARASEGKLAWLLPLEDKLAGRSTAQARLLSVSDDFPAAWEVVDCLGKEVAQAYWQEFRTIGRGADYPFVNDTARKLLSNDRPAAALDLLVLYRDSKVDLVDEQLVVDAFEQLLSKGDPEIRLLSNYEIERLLEHLRRSTISEDVLALLEWRLLPALDPLSHAAILERRMARDPAFFVEIFSLSFRPDSDDSDGEIDSRVARNAFRLLLDWKHIPGTDEPGGAIDEQRLRSWLFETRDLLREAGRLRSGDNQIGKVFAHSQIGDDGVWPAVAVRNLIEESESADLETGLQVGTISSRGVTSRSLDAGGDQEYQLAQKYYEWAIQSADRWPRTAAVLRAIADRYRAEGRSHDEEAQRFRRGLDR
jgi:hypothetical protein